MMWKRFPIFRVWATALLDAADEHVEVLVAGSEGRASRDLAQEYGFHYVEVPNEPIGRKANVRFAACQELNPDYVILCGSDDIVSKTTFNYYRKLAQQGVDEVCINDIYYLNAHTGAMAYSPGYVDHRAGEPIAPWRMLSRRMCEALDWKGWHENERLFLDGHIYRRLEKIPHATHRIHVRKEGLFVCDVKSQVNMTRWHMRSHWEAIKPSMLAEYLSQKVIKALDKLKGPITDTAYLGVKHLKN